MINKKAQVTIFVIIAIVIVAVVVLFFALRQEKINVNSVPSSLEAPYTAFLSCLTTDIDLGIRILESQGGYIDPPTFEPGSQYMPFSNQLNFVGTPIPYWYYVSGNNIQKEQVPSLTGMSDSLASFIEERINKCDLRVYESYDISLGSPKASAVILEDRVQVSLNMDVGISKNLESASVKNHEVVVSSNLGKLYDSALKVYQQEQDELFLENYGIDVLGLYAPVDGVELTCSPITWDAGEVFDNLREAIEVNTLALKSKGEKEDYFYVDLGVNENVRFLNSRNWPSSFEVDSSEGQLLISTPVGNQPGLGILGFCYVPYHYVYSMRYPVLIQVYEGAEIFQFPVAIVIDKNRARVALTSTAVEREIPDLCMYKNTFVEVNVVDYRNNPVESDISYECSGTTCYIGKAENGVLRAEFPQCVGGRIITRAQGYKETSYSYSVTNEGQAKIYLDKFYGLDVQLKVDGRAYSGEAIVSFVSNDTSATILYPEQREIQLTPGEYEVQVYVYENSTLKLGSSITQECLDVPKTGIGGIIGLTEKKCFDVEIPEQIISRALSGGGKTKVYALYTMLEKSNSVEINAPGLPNPTTLEELQNNYMLFEDKVLDVNFR